MIITACRDLLLDVTGIRSSPTSSANQILPGIPSVDSVVHNRWSANTGLIQAAAPARLGRKEAACTAVVSRPFVDWRVAADIRFATRGVDDDLALRWPQTPTADAR